MIETRAASASPKGKRERGKEKGEKDAHPASPYFRKNLIITIAKEERGK